MAIFHLSVKTISRSAGRSATAAAAYRAGVEITDERTGEIHDYTRKGGVESAALILPDNAPEWATDRAKLWNAAEQAEKRKNSTVAREFEIALPAELPAAERQALAHDFARALVARHGCAADVAIHAPGKEGDNRNHHAHILLTTRRLGPDGFGEKTRELDDQKVGKVLVTEWRERWAGMANASLERHGHAERIDHRSHAARGIEAAPSQHLGPAATGYERRTGEPSRLRLDFAAEVAERLARARELGELERQSKAAGVAVIDLSCDLNAAKAERHRQEQQAEQERQQASQKPAGIDPRSRYHPDAIAARATAERAAEQAAAQKAQAEREAWARKAEAAARQKPPEAPQRAERSAPVPMPTPAPVRAPQARPDPAQAERERLARMSAADLAAEIKRLRPQAVANLVAGDADVAEAAEVKQRWQKAVELGQRREWEAEKAAHDWREENPKRAWLHDKGLSQSPRLRELAQLQEQGRQEWQKAAPRAEEAATRHRSAEGYARERIRQEQAPVLLKLAELEKLHQDKARQERAAEAARQEREAVPKDFRSMAASRAVKAYGWGDSGSKWQAAPEQLKKLIDGYNAAPKAAQPAILERILSDAGRREQVRELMAEQRQQHRAQDRGYER